MKKLKKGEKQKKAFEEHAKQLGKSNVCVEKDSLPLSEQKNIL